jgi:hypothetical protein
MDVAATDIAAICAATDAMNDGLGGDQLCGGDGRGGRGGGNVTSIAQERHQARGNNVPSNKNFVSNSSNRHYRNRLENEPININAASTRAASAAGISSPSAGGAAGISSPSITDPLEGD